MGINEIFKSVLGLQRENSEKSIDFINLLQKRYLEGANEIIDFFSPFPDTGKNLINQWNDMMKSTNSLLTVSVDKGYKELEMFFARRK